MNKHIVTLLVLATITSFASEKTLNDLFPPELQDEEIKQKPLTEERKDFLREHGASDFAVDTYGPVYVKGYNSDHLRWGDLPLGENGTVSFEYDASAAATFPPLPKQGHPRIFCTDAEREEHLQRLTETDGGKVALKVVMATTELLKGNYGNDAEYAQPDWWQGSFGGTKGMLPLFRYGKFGNPKNKQIWDAYATGKVHEMSYNEKVACGIVDPIVDKEKKPVLDEDGKPKSRTYSINMGLLAMEAYRCWVFDDADNGRKVANALESALKLGLKDKKTIGGFNTAFVYDFAYKFMTPEQRSLALSCLLKMNVQNNQYGCFQDAEGTTSNWATFSYRILQFLATEGDPGYNDLMYLGYNRGMNNYLTYGWFNAGTCFEGMGKNQLSGENVYMLHRRGSQIAGHPHLLAHVKNYMPHAILPWGGEYIAYDRLGGVKDLNFHDYLPLKNLYPDDKVVDWVYRNAVLDDYSFLLGDDIRVEGYFNNAMFVAVFLRDFMKDNDDPSKLGLEESFIDPHRALMITRSDWSKDASYLQHHVRGRSGGHVFSDRGNIVFAGKGKLWIVNGSHSYKTVDNNVVTIDDRNAPNNAPAKMVDYKRDEFTTFSTADMRDTYNWETGAAAYGKFSCEQVEAGEIAPPEGWEWNDFSRNRYALTESSDSSFTTPEYLMPSWIDPGKVTTATRKKSDFQMKAAFRTAGMVRGDYPYALVVDDYEAEDGLLHEYTWRARLPKDVFVFDSKTYLPDGAEKGNEITDITIAPHNMYSVKKGFGKNASGIPARGTPMLLIRVLKCSGETVDVNKKPGSDMLEISTKAVNPEFKIMLFAYRHGESPLPKTKWLDKSTIEIDFGNRQKDVIKFNVDDEGRTILDVDRISG